MTANGEETGPMELSLSFDPEPSPQPAPDVRGPPPGLRAMGGLPPPSRAPSGAHGITPPAPYRPTPTPTLIAKEPARPIFHDPLGGPTQMTTPAGWQPANTPEAGQVTNGNGAMPHVAGFALGWQTRVWKVGCGCVAVALGLGTIWHFVDRRSLRNQAVAAVAAQQQSAASEAAATAHLRETEQLLATARETIARFEAEAASRAASEAKRQEEMRAVAERHAALAPKLAAGLEALDVRVAAEGERLLISLPSAALFETDDSDLSNNGVRLILRVGHQLEASGLLAQRQFTVVGQPDEAKGKGKGQGNSKSSALPADWDQAASRAALVAGLLMDEVGVKPDHLTTGVAPVARDPKRKGRPALGRVDIVLSPLGEAAPRP